MRPIQLLDAIKDNTDAFFGINIAKRSRQGYYLKARQFFCKYVKEYHPFYTLETIGMQLGGRDHSTVINAIQSFDDAFDTESKYRKDYALYLQQMRICTELGINSEAQKISVANIVQSLNHKNLLKPFLDIAKENNVSITNVFIDCLYEYAQIKGYDISQK